jgi:hypothetical protein
MNRIAITIGAASLLLLSQMACAEVPHGWFANIPAPGDFSVATDNGVTYQGHPSVSISSKKPDPTGFAGFNQSISAKDYKGKRVRLSAYLRTRDVTGDGSRGAHVWFRVDGPNQKMLGFDNMDTRPVKGSTEWTKYEIVLDVPSESIGLAYGSFLNGSGTSWVASFRLEVVSDAVLATNNLLLHPTNLNFDR